MNYGMDFQGGGASGGGYTNSSTFGSPGASQGGQRRNYNEQTLTPVSISMVLKSKSDPAGDGSLLLQDGRHITTVKLVAASRGFTDNSTNIVYDMEDGTGLVEVKQWLNDDDSTALQEIRQSTLKHHMYLKIIGQVKDYEGKKLIVANSVRPLTTGNELTHHFLEVVHSAEAHKRGDSIVAAPLMGNSGVGFGGMGAQVGPALAASGTGDSLKDKLLDFIRRMDGDGLENGADIKDCFGKFGGHSDGEIRLAVQALSEEGHVYSTVSEDHFKPAN